MESLGERIAELRKKNQLTQQELADKINIKRELINYYENETRQPKINDVINMSKIFDVTTDYILLGGNCKKADNFEINKRLGLSDESIESIKSDYRKKDGKLRMKIMNYLFSEFWISWIIEYIGKQMVNLVMQNAATENLEKSITNELSKNIKFTKFEIIETLGKEFDKLCKELLPTFERMLLPISKSDFERLEDIKKATLFRNRKLEDLIMCEPSLQNNEEGEEENHA